MKRILRFIRLAGLLYQTLCYMYDHRLELKQDSADMWVALANASLRTKERAYFHYRYSGAQKIMEHLWKLPR